MEFVWWVHYTLRKRINLISKVKSRYWKRTHKYGIEIPKTSKHAMHLGKKNRTNLWRLSWDKYMKSVQVDFDVKDDGDVVTIGYQ